jgi:hypothetical protein
MRSPISIFASAPARLSDGVFATLSGSKHANMKELRFRADGGVWRIAFAFDSERAAILLVGGNKSGVSSGRFYKGLIKRADARFDQHLEALK